MKPASAELLALLQTNNFLIGDLFAFRLRDGAEDYFSALDVPVTYRGNVYRADGLRIEGLRFKLAVGLQVDEQNVRISARPGETLAGADFLTTVGSGLLDGAYLTRLRAFWQRTTGVPSGDYQLPPVGVIGLCTMLVSQIEKIGRTHVDLQVKSPTKLLDLDMPRNYYSPGCVHTLFDQGCTLQKFIFSKVGTVASATLGPQQVPWNGGVPSPTGADSLPYFAQGRLLFTSGELKNLQVSIGTNDATNLYLNYPLQQFPAPGDGFIAYPGCSKTKATCSAKFDNVLNFRGFPFVPPVYISV